jgi:GMP synthase-like glutamine amidotransferase
MGGMMGAYEEDKHPWLVVEKKFIERAIADNRRVLGICLGAQLVVAEVLGAKVGPHCYREIGWFPVELTAKARALDYFKGCATRFDAFHWHGDSFTLPASSIQLARSEACEQQGFLYGDKVMALQFHPEVSAQEIAAFLDEGADELEIPPLKFVQSAAAIRGQDAKAEPMQQFLTGLLDRFFID